jgi:predicted glycosyltransferase
MRVGIFTNTPAHVHLYRNAIAELEERGHETVVFARDDGCALDLLEYFGINHYRYASRDTTKRNLFLQLPSHLRNIYRILRKEELDLVFGMGLYSAFAGAVSGTPAISVTDSEPMAWRHVAMSPFVEAFLTPDAVTQNLGSKHYAFTGLKETAYLHPDVYTSTGTVREELGVGDDPFVIVRFNAFNGHHDVGRRGFTPDQKAELITRLDEHATVFVSDETGVLDFDASAARPYDAHPALMHEALAEAELLIADTQTMITEAALLGTPGIRSNSFVGDDDMGNFKALERAGLVYNFSEFESVVSTAEELLARDDTAETWEERRQEFLSDKCNLTALIVELVERTAATGSVDTAVRENEELFRRRGSVFSSP